MYRRGYFFSRSQCINTSYDLHVESKMIRAADLGALTHVLTQYN